MDDFNDLIEKALVPISVEENLIIGTSDLASERKLTAPKDIESKEVLKRRYVEIMNMLFVNAKERNSVDVFSEVITSKLAEITYAGGTTAIGDLLNRFGVHIGSLSEIADAQVESDVLKWNGYKLN
jgi:hypothetical protein